MLNTIKKKMLYVDISLHYPSNIFLHYNSNKNFSKPAKVTVINIYLFSFILHFSTSPYKTKPQTAFLSIHFLLPKKVFTLAWPMTPLRIDMLPGCTCPVNTHLRSFLSQPFNRREDPSPCRLGDERSPVRRDPRFRSPCRWKVGLVSGDLANGAWAIITEMWWGFWARRVMNVIYGRVLEKRLFFWLWWESVFSKKMPLFGVNERVGCVVTKRFEIGYYTVNWVVIHVI